MMRTGNYKISCFVLALLLYLSVIFFVDVRVNTLYLTSPAARAGGDGFHGHTVLHNAGLRIAEMLEVHGDDGINKSGAGVSGNKGGNAGMPDMVCPDISVTGQGKYFSKKQSVRLYRWYAGRLISIFIHKSDGKKRPLCSE